ncbi:MAG TPA: dTMP kinase [Patescibacteria group bacterium]|nr:dTMP kinase [Patescibacteria group bacterium]
MTPDRDPRRGLFITLEGPDGSGKTVQAERLRTAAAATGREALLVREPGGTPAGERIRAILMDRHESSVLLTQRADALLFMAARAQLVEAVIRPALERGVIVLSDRYLDSTLAYQGYGGLLGVQELLPVGRFATGGLRPDLTILFDVPVGIGLARKSDAELTRFEAHFDRAYHERVRAGYLALAAAEPDRWVIVDASAPEADVLAAARGALLACLDRAAPTG